MGRAADEALISDTGFIQLTASVKWIRRVSERGRVLLRGHAGYTEANEFAKLPPSIRFFAGGDNSIRGYDFKSLGPLDKTNQSYPRLPWIFRRSI